MSEQDDRSIGNGNDGWASWPFVRIFTQGGFRAAIQPGKIMLAVLGILALFIAGGILDIMTPYSARVVAMTGHNLSLIHI